MALAEATGRLTSTQVAAKCGMSERSLYSWVKRGWFPEPEWLGGRRFWRATTIEQVLSGEWKPPQRAG
jgi:predicted DNA-binding transcriptional regulator AlpA